MNSKTLEMLQKFVGEEDNEDFENLDEKINIFGEQTNENDIYNNNLLDNNEDINKLFEKINNLESKEKNEDKDLDENNEIDNENNKENQDKNDNELLKNNKLEILTKIIIKKEVNSKLIHFNRWKNLNLINQENDIEKENNSVSNEENKLNNDINGIKTNDNINENDIDNKKKESKINNNDKDNENDNSLNQILSQNNEEDNEDHTQSEIITKHQNQLLSGEPINFNTMNNSFTQINDINFDNIFPQNKTEEEINHNNNKESSKNNFNNLLAFSLFNIINNKLFLYQKILFSALKHKSIISNYYDKLYQLDKLNKKYEAILDEKSSIIINKTDEMEEMKEKIEKLTKNLKEANKKNKNLNVIQESLCAKCGGSLEESFTGDVIAENQKIIKEQEETIEKLKIELNELKSKYNLSEIRLKDLNNIKKEYENLSGSLLKPKIDNEVQTDESLFQKQNNLNSKNSNNSNINIQIYNNNINNNNKNINISNSKKGSKKKNIPKKINFSNSSNNVYMNTSTGHNKNQKADSDTNNNSEINNEILTSLRFDNSVLSNELLNLNREFNKLRNEHKVASEKIIKLDKEKKDLIDKLKTKTDLCDKYKKENDEITRMINNTKYKNIINAETENKKLKSILEQNDSDIKKLKNMNEKCAKKILEQNNQIEKMKTALGSLLNFKQQKEKLIIENKNYENEIQNLKNELNEERNKNEKNVVLIDSKDKEIEKLVNDVKYYSFHIKKYKSDAERALEDAIGYQKIVALLEIQLNQYKEQLDTIKNVKTEE